LYALLLFPVFNKYQYKHNDKCSPIWTTHFNFFWYSVPITGTDVYVFADTNLLLRTCNEQRTYYTLVP
jgi:hypothetical protein